MAKLMSPSITNGQIGKLQDLLGAALRKSGLPGNVVQQVIETDGEPLVSGILSALRSRVEAHTGEIVQRVFSIDRARVPKQALIATGRRLYVDDAVIDTMPRGEGNEVELVFFKPDVSAYKSGWLSCQTLEREYEKHGLAPDPIALAKFAEENAAFFDDKPVCCQWRDANGNYCCAAFRRWFDERLAGVCRNDVVWNDSWSFAGVRKKSSASAL